MADPVDSHYWRQWRKPRTKVRSLIKLVVIIGKDGTIDLSPSKRLFITEAEIVTKLFNGVKLLLEKEAAAKE